MGLLNLQSGFTSLFDERVEGDPERLYFTFAGTPYTFGEVGRMVDRVRAWLHAVGAAPGDRIAIMMDSSPVHVALILALAKSRITWVPVNTRLRKDGLRYVLDHSEPRFVVVDPAHLESLAAAGVDQADKRLLVIGPAGVPEQGPAPTDQATALPDEQFAILYTSGTTGPPKGVMITHLMMQYSAEAVALLTEASRGDVMLVWEPLVHIGGAQMLLLPLVRPVSLAMVGRFSASRFWRQVSDAKATHIHYLGGILDILLSQPESPFDCNHSVRMAWGAGCSEATWLAFENRFGVRIRECYGMSEASSITTVNMQHVIGSVGTPLQWFEVQIVGPDGKALGCGEAGEIVVTPRVPGPIFAGYFRNPEASARSLRDGRLHTGDLGQLDEENNLFFLGRQSDSVRHKGENVSAWEVESVANKHEHVASSAMIGVPGELGEQDIMLFVQPAEGVDFDVPAFARWLAGELASYQMPRYIQLVVEFERTPSERIMKHKLQADPHQCWDRQSRRSALSN